MSEHSEYQYRQLVSHLREMTDRWRDSEPDRQTLTGNIEMWQDDIKKMNMSGAVKSQALRLAELELEQAHNSRINVSNAIKSVAAAADILEQDTRPRPPVEKMNRHQRASIKAMYGDKVARQYGRGHDTGDTVPQAHRAVKSFVDGWRTHIDDALNVPQHNRVYFQQHPLDEGQVYAQTIARAKAFLMNPAGDYEQVQGLITDASHARVSQAYDALHRAEDIAARRRVLTGNDRDTIQNLLRTAYKSLEGLEVQGFTTQHYPELFEAFARIGNGAQAIAPMVNYRQDYAVKSQNIDLHQDIYDHVKPLLEDIEGLWNLVPEHMPEVMDAVGYTQTAVNVLMNHPDPAVKSEAVEAMIANMNAAASYLAQRIESGDEDLPFSHRGYKSHAIRTRLSDIDVFVVDGRIYDSAADFGEKLDEEQGDAYIVTIELNDAELHIAMAHFIQEKDAITEAINVVARLFENMPTSYATAERL